MLYLSLNCLARERVRADLPLPTGPPMPGALSQLLLVCY